MRVCDASGGCKYAPMGSAFVCRMFRSYSSRWHYIRWSGRPCRYFSSAGHYLHAFVLSKCSNSRLLTMAKHDWAPWKCASIGGPGIWHVIVCCMCVCRRPSRGLVTSILCVVAGTACISSLVISVPCKRRQPQLHSHDIGTRW